MRERQRCRRESVEQRINRYPSNNPRSTDEDEDPGNGGVAGYRCSHTDQFLSRNRYAAIEGDIFRWCRSTVTPIAQMKPKSSRPTAVTTCC